MANSVQGHRAKCAALCPRLVEPKEQLGTNTVPASLCRRFMPVRGELTCLDCPGPQVDTKERPPLLRPGLGIVSSGACTVAEDHPYSR